MTVLERLEAFRDLIRHGNALLGDVVAYCREAESAVAQLATEKQEIDRARAATQEMARCAGAEAEAARAALAGLDAQRQELSTMREELLKARAEMNRVQQAQVENAATLERSVADAKLQQRRLEQELQRLHAQAVSSQALDARLGELDKIEAKLRGTERELADTRRALEEERSRRDRAIALIKPRPVPEEIRP